MLILWYCVCVEGVVGRDDTAVFSALGEGAQHGSPSQKRGVCGKHCCLKTDGFVQFFRTS